MTKVVENTFRAVNIAFANELANTVDAAAFDWGFPGLAAAIGVELTNGMYEVVAGDRTAEDLVEAVDELSAPLFN